MKLSSIGEFSLIERLKRKLRTKDNSVIAGAGDDAAVLRIAATGKRLLFTTDTLVENVHFDLKYSSCFQLGWKLLAVNISDIAAMGGIPKYAVVTLGLNDRMSVRDIDAFYAGMKKLSRKFKVEIVGGDIVTSPRALFFTLDLLGEAKRPVLRSGARPSDVIMAIGKFGASAAGLRSLKAHGRKSSGAKAHLMPMPMIKEGLAASMYATAMIDNSDGLARCLIEICRASRVGAKIYLDKVPLAKGADLHDALDGGEDYNLLLTVPKRSVKKIKGKVIGEIIKPRNILAVDGRGRSKVINEKGYEHL